LKNNIFCTLWNMFFYFSTWYFGLVLTSNSIKLNIWIPPWKFITCHNTKSYLNIVIYAINVCSLFSIGYYQPAHLLPKGREMSNYRHYYYIVSGHPPCSQSVPYSISHLYKVLSVSEYIPHFLFHLNNTLRIRYLVCNLYYLFMFWRVYFQMKGM
jgi:hypothetical protein